MRLVLAVFAAFIALATLSACGTSESASAGAKEPIPLTKVDRDAWTAAIHSAVPESRENPDLDSLYETTVSACEGDVDDLVLQFTLVGSQPELVRVSMQQVCPSKVGMVDKALVAYESLNAETEALCSSDPATLTGDDVEKYDVICTDYEE